MTTYKPLTVGKKYIYKIGTDGTIIKAGRKTYKESMATPYLKHGKLTVKVNNREFVLKHLVAKAFIKSYKKGLSVIHKDGNFRNCAADNLIVMTKQELGRLTGGESRRQAVVVDGEKHYSIRAAAKALHCSYQTLLDYMDGKVKNSVLNGTKVRKLDVYEVME